MPNATRIAKDIVPRPVLTGHRSAHPETDQRWSRKKIASRQRILAAARKLFVEHGYHQVRIRDIANEASLGQGSFYFHFEDKLECFRAFANDAAAELDEFVQPYLSTADTFIERMRALLRGSFDYSLRYPGVLRAIAADIRVLSIDEGYSSLRRWPDMFAVIEQCKERGEIPGSTDSRLLTYLMAGAIRQGDVLISHSPAKKDEILENILTFMTRGLEPGQPSSYDEEELPRTAEILPRMDVRSIFGVVTQDNADGSSQKKIINRRKILDAARRLFTEHGYDDVGPAEISKAAGVGIGTFYSFFEDKFECFLAFIDEANYELTQNVTRRLSSVTTFPAIINQMIENHFEYTETNPGVFPALIGDIKILSKKAKVTNRGRSEWTCQYIDNLKKVGKIDSGFDSRFLAYLIGGALSQTNAYLADHPGKREKTIESIGRFILNAIRVRPH